MTWLKWYSDQAHRPVIVSTEKPSVPAGGTPGQLLARKLAMTLGQTSFLENSIVLPNRGSLNRADSNLRPSLQKRVQTIFKYFPSDLLKPHQQLTAAQPATPLTHPNTHPIYSNRKRSRRPSALPPTFQSIKAPAEADTRFQPPQRPFKNNNFLAMNHITRCTHSRRGAI
jgi:hypothetical protein